MAGQRRPTSVWPPMTSYYYQTVQSLPQWPAIICHYSSSSTPNSPRLMGLLNIKKADRARYAEACDKYLAEACDKYLAEAGETRTVEQVMKIFSKEVNKASGLFIPAGRIQHFQPTLPASAKSLADERDRKRGLNPADETLNDLNKQIQNLEVEDKRTNRQPSFDKCDHRTGISHLWRIVKSLCGIKPHNSPKKDVRFADTNYLDSKKIANKCAHQYIPPPMHMYMRHTMQFIPQCPKGSSNGNFISC